MNKSYCPIPGASQPKEPVRMINANALKKRVVKVMFRDTPEIGEFYAVGTCDIDIMPTIDPDALRPTAHWNQLNESELTGWNPEFAGYDPIGSYECSNCHAEAVFNCDGEFVLSKYCPNCGARMVNANEQDNKNH